MGPAWEEDLLLTVGVAVALATALRRELAQRAPGSARLPSTRALAHPDIPSS